MLRPKESEESEQPIIECISPHLESRSTPQEHHQTVTAAAIVPQATQPAADDSASQTSPALFAPHSPTSIPQSPIRFSPIRVHYDVTALTLPYKRSRTQAWQDSNHLNSQFSDQSSPEREPISYIEPNDDQRSVIFSPLNHQDHARYINLSSKRPRFE